MTQPRYNYAGISLSGQQTYTKCDGTQVVTSLQTTTRVSGSSKAPVVRGNKILQTPYWAAWVSQHVPASVRYKTTGHGSCTEIIGNTGHPWFNPVTRKKTIVGSNTLPLPTKYFPLHTMFLGRDAVVNTVPIETAAFTSIKAQMTNPHLNKIKEQGSMALVSLAETKKTVQLTRSLFGDVVESLKAIATGIYSPRSLVDKYLKYAMKNGLRGLPKGAKQSKLLAYSENERKFIRNMQKYYRKHPTLHKRLLEGIPATAANRWLQFRYGIGPLLSDLNAAHTYLYTSWADFVHKNDIVVKYREKGSASAASTTNNDNLGVITAKTKWKAEYISRFFISNHVAHVARKTGFSPAELAATIWELIPWSFVFDWFYDFGGYLSAASATAGLTHRRTSFSIKEEATAIIRNATENFFGISGKPASTDGSAKYGGFIRKVYDDFPFPVPPTLTMPFSSIFSKRGIDTLALLFGKRDFSLLTNR